jgi:hypothetical protein
VLLADRDGLPVRMVSTLHLRISPINAHLTASLITSMSLIRVKAGIQDSTGFPVPPES